MSLDVLARPSGGLAMVAMDQRESLRGMIARHRTGPVDNAELTTFPDRLALPITDEALTSDLPPYVHPGRDSEELEYLVACRRSLGTSWCSGSGG